MTLINKWWARLFLKIIKKDRLLVKDFLLFRGRISLKEIQYYWALDLIIKEKGFLSYLKHKKQATDEAFLRSVLYEQSAKEEYCRYKKGQK